MISAAFQYKGWSKVTTLGSLCFMAKLQTKSNVDTMHDLSPEYILIIGKQKTERSETYDMDKGVCALGDSGQLKVMSSIS